jgi:hypothetical protein
MQAEAIGLLSKMWKAISAKRTGIGWILFLLSLLLHLSEKWDSLASFYEKLKKMGPFFKFLTDAAHSPLVQLVVFAAGVIWIGLAAFFSVKASEKKKNNGMMQPAPPVQSPVPTIPVPDLADPAYDRFWLEQTKPTPKAVDPHSEMTDKLMKHGMAVVPPRDSQHAIDNQTRGAICSKLSELAHHGEQKLSPLQTLGNLEAWFSGWSKMCEDYLDFWLDHDAVRLFRTPTLHTPYNPINIDIDPSAWAQWDLNERISSRVMQLRIIIDKVNKGELPKY